MSDVLWGGMTPTENLPLDDHGRIETDVQCLACGYNLRSLLPDGRCPECGTAVGKSIHGDLLRFSEPGWVESLASGMNWIVMWIVVSVLASVLLGVVYVQAAARGGPVGRSAETAGLLVGVVTGLINVMGYWKVATPEPRQLNSTDGLTANQIVRIAVVSAYALGLFNYFRGYLNNAYLQIAFALVVNAATIVAFVSLAVVVRRLARRIPNHKLARSTTIVMWGYCVLMTLSAIWGLALWHSVTVAGRTGAPASATASVGFLMAPIGCGIAVFAIWGLILLLRYRRAFSQAAQGARATWAATADPLESVRL